MADLSQYSDDQLKSMLGEAPAPQSSDLSHYSDDQLKSMLSAHAEDFQNLPENERPVVTENPGSHPTYSAPTFNSNPFTALLRGANTGLSNIQDMNYGLAGKFLGMKPEEVKDSKDFVNSKVFKPENIKPSMPGTGSNVIENIGNSAVSSIPVMAGGMFGPVGMGAAGAVEAFAKDENVPIAFAKNAALAKLWQVGGSLGSKAFVDAATKLGVPASVASREFLKRSGSTLGGGLTGAVTSNGSPDAIAQGAGFNALYPSEPFKKSDIVPEKLANSAAYSVIKSYVKPWAKDFKYLHDPIRGILNENLTFNNADQAAEMVKQRKDEVGAQIRQTIDNSSAGGQTSDYSNIASPIDSMISKMSKSPKSNASIIKRLMDAKDDILGTKYDANGNVTSQKDLSALTPKEAFDLKQQVDDLTKWTGNLGDDKPTNSALQDSYRIIRDTINKQIPELKDFNQRYGDLSEAAKRMQYRADASNPLLNGVSAVKDIGLAAVLGHGNPVLTASLIAAERAGKTGFVKSRMANALYTRPDFAKVPNPSFSPQVMNNPAQTGFTLNRFQQIANQKSPQMGLPSPKDVPYTPSQHKEFKLGTVAERPFGAFRRGDVQSKEVIEGTRPEKPYTPGPEAISHKPVPEDVKAQAKEKINEENLRSLGMDVPPMSQFNPIKKGVKALAVAGALTMGSALGNQAQAAQNLDLKKINQIESSGNEKAIGDNGKAFGLNQIHMPTLNDFNKAHKTNYTKDDLLHGELNNKVADWYYNNEIPRLLKHYKIQDTLQNRISAYNEGIGSFAKRVKNGDPMPPITKKYLKKYGLK